MNVQRPWATGWGWPIAVLVLIIAVLSLLIPQLAGATHLLTWLIIGLAAALVAG